MSFRSALRLMSLPHDPPDRTKDRAVDPAGPDTWSALMAAAQDGHGGAYRRLLNETTDWLQRYFRRRLPPGDVDDAVQEALLAIHRRRHTFDPRQPFGPWMAAIAKRKWVDQLRTIARRPTEELSDDLAVADHESAVMCATTLTGLLVHLRPAQAHAIRMVKLQGYSIEDACRETGLTASAVKMNIHRGLARLTALIEDADDLH
ncbi:sigma-70 family RNA polymerase sigma factor [Methylorubrum suomiense]